MGELEQKFGMGPQPQNNDEGTSRQVAQDKDVRMESAMESTVEEPSKAAEVVSPPNVQDLVPLGATKGKARKMDEEDTSGGEGEGEEDQGPYSDIGEDREEDGESDDEAPVSRVAFYRKLANHLLGIIWHG